MPEFVWVGLLDALPTALWVGFALLVFLTLRRPLLQEILPRVSEIRGLGVELTLGEAEELLEKAAEHAPGRGPVHAGQASPLAGAEGSSVVARLEHAASLLKGGRILWVDDVPGNNRYLVRLFEELGMRVDQVTSTSQALEKADRNSYDMVISDIARDGDERAGIDMVELFRKNQVRLPVIFHSEGFDPRLGLDPMVFAGTSGIGLVHYVIDVMERIRFAHP
ncbi:hypothetical protein GCM10027294_51410 [Marinactinospora endophytica]